MKKVLITGVNGFIGQALYNKLSSLYAVYGSSRNNIHNIANWLYLDLSVKPEVNLFFKENKFDVIIHLATVLANKDNARDVSVFNDNLKIHTNLAEALDDYTGCHLINFSSSAVYPNLTGSFSEMDEINPSVNSDGLYGLAKFAGEMVFKAILPKQIVQLHLRTGFVYGEGMNNSRIHPMFEQELGEHNFITVFGDGLRTIPQIEIESLCKRIQYFITNCVAGTFNFADENISLKLLAQRIIDRHGNEQSYIKCKEEGNRQEFKLNLQKLNLLFND
ncbi:MAG: NAD(P)-dependent oxidoreductase [Bacteroidota bacterium]